MTEKLLVTLLTLLALAVFFPPTKMMVQDCLGRIKSRDFSGGSLYVGFLTLVNLAGQVTLVGITVSVWLR